VRDGLRLAFSCTFSSVEARHVITERAGTMTIPSGRSFTLLFCTGGTVAVRASGTEAKLRPNEALVIEPEGTGSLRVRHPGGAELYLVRFRWKGQQTGAPQRLIEVPRHGTVARPARLTHILRMYTEKARHRGTSRAMLYHLLALALWEISCPAGQAHVRQPVQSLESIASRVDAFIAAHYHEQIGTPEIARELRYNPGYLERVYRQERRISIRDSLHARRIREARAQLLLLRETAVGDIAALCGFTDPAYFRRLFKKTTNMSPGRFRAVSAPRPSGGPS
jgi:AraC-like DNA-binding protein